MQVADCAKKSIPVPGMTRKLS